MKATQELFEFVWWKPKPGSCHWTSAIQISEPKAKPHECVTDGVAFGERGVGRIPYQPLEQYSGLFRTFAETVPSKEGILGFASEYGFLGLAESVASPKGGFVFPGEAQGDPWGNEIFRMREVVQLWDAIKFGRVDFVKARLSTAENERGVLISYGSGGAPDDGSKWLDDLGQFGSTGLPPGWNGVVIADEETQPELIRAYLQGAIFTPIRQLIHRAINKKLQQFQVTARVLWQDDKPVWRLVPTSLIGALWFQFMRAYTADADHRQCVTCARWFEVSARTGERQTRKDRIYCSTACKTRSHRSDRKKESKRRTTRRERQ